MYFRHIDAAAAVAGGASAELTRRQFLKLSTLAGSGLTLGMLLPGCAPGTGTGAKGAAATGPLAMPFVRISPENTVTVICKHVEGGQGVWTGLPAIVAEELDAAWAQMRVENAPAQVPLYGNTAFDPRGTMQGTGGSSSLANSWLQLRQAGATARAMLVTAAAQTWKVPAGEITVSEGVVAHAGARQQEPSGNSPAPPRSSRCRRRSRSRTRAPSSSSAWTASSRAWIHGRSPPALSNSPST